MYQVLNCLVFEHDWRLVVLGGSICWLASTVAISLFHRAKASQGRTRVIWVGLDATVGGCGIWATHFVAMLAYDPGIGAAYNIPVTLMLLVFAVTVAYINDEWPPERAASAAGAYVSGTVVGGFSGRALVPSRALRSKADGSDGNGASTVFAEMRFSARGLAAGP